MKSINVVYDGEYNDVDIVQVPDSIAENIGTIVWEFNDWLSTPINQQRFLIKHATGNMVLSVNTKDFLWWLNSVKILEEPKAEIVTQHTIFDPTFPTAEF